LLLFILPVAVFGQETTIVPDRPGFSTGTSTVKLGRFQFELGYQYSFNNQGIDQSTQTIPQLVFRTGVSSHFEFDFLWDGFNIDETDNQSSKTSVSDFAIGGKYRMIERQAFNVTLLGLFSLPVGSEPSTSDGVDPTIGLLWDYSCIDRFPFFGALQLTSTSGGNSGR